MVPWAVSAVSGSQVWVLGTVGCGENQCPAVVFGSQDGGRAWSRLATPGVMVGWPGTIGVDRVEVSGLTFADPLNGWMWGPGLWSTHDGGRTWTDLRPAGSVLSVKTSNGTVWVLTGDCVGGPPCRSYALRRAPVARDSLVGIALPARLTGMAPALAVSGRRVVLLDNTDPAPGHDMSVLLSSPDGGAHWNRRPGPCFRDFGGGLWLVADVVWAVCPTGMLAGIWRSTNDGPFRSADGRSRPWPNFVSVVATGPDTAVAASFGVFRTTDAGAHWQSSRSGHSTDGGARWFSFSFPDPREGWGLVNDDGTVSLVRSIDAGRSWTDVSLRDRLA